jgi:serine/threonine protein kinase
MASPEPQDTTAAYSGPSPDGRTAARAPAPETSTEPWATAGGAALGRSATGDGRRELAAVPGYEILEELGRGGMGVVYKARQTSLKRTVALKMILAGAHAAPEELNRFRHEAEAVAQLQHPNIVQVYDIGEAGGLPFISLEFVDGGTLAQRTAGQPLPPAEAAGVVEVVARAVHHAHERGIVHRDLKPANILLQRKSADYADYIDKKEGTYLPVRSAESAKSADGFIPRITDFGLAKQLQGGSGATRSGAILGTPSYMAPEQASGAVHQIGPHTDVYALGAILYDLLTGRPPFQAPTPLEVLTEVIAREPLPPRRLQPRLPSDLETICLKALAKEPAHRYASAGDLADDLHRFQAGEPIQARRVGLPTRLWRKARRRPLACVSVLGLLLALAIVGYVGPRAYRAGRVAVTVQEIENGLQAPQMTEEYLGHMERLIAELEALLPENAAPARQRLYQRFAEQIRERLGERLTADQAAPLRTAIGWLAPRDPVLAAQLGRECDQRLSRWEPAFALHAPFANLDQVLWNAPNLVQGAVGNELHRRTATGARTDPYVFTQPTCTGNVKLTAIYGPSWAQAAQLGMTLGSGKSHGYVFLLTVRESFDKLGDTFPREPLRATFADARRGNKDVVMVLVRSDPAGEQLHKRVAQKPVDPAALFADCPPDGTLRLEMRREGDQVVVQVNRQHLVEFRDVFPIGLGEPVSFGLNWSAGVTLRGLEAERLASPAVSSPLESGDELYNRKDYEGARARYQALLRQTTSDPVRQEARYKEGLCLLAQKQTKDAIAVFQPLAAEGGEADTQGRHNWPVLASGQLLLIYHRQNTPAARTEANAILDSLLSRRNRRPGELAAVIPYEDREAIILARSIDGLRAFLSKPEDLLSDCDRADKAATLFEHDDLTRMGRRLQLVKACHLAGQETQALRTSKDLLREFERVCAAEGLWATWVLDNYCWLLRRRGADGARQALRDLDQWLFTAPGVLRRDGTGTVYFPLVERARIHAALAQWDQAEQDLERFFREQKQDARRYYSSHASACLLQGFLRERAGDKDGAQAAWRRGLVQSWTKDNPADPSGHALTMNLNIDFIYQLILASLTGQLSDREAEDALTRLLTEGERNRTIITMVRLLNAPPGVLRDMWLHPRGREWARRIAYKDLSYGEYTGVPFLLFSAEFLHQRVLPGPLSAEHEALLWKLSEDLRAAWVNETLTQSHLVSLGYAWKGLDFGWTAVDGAVLKAQPQLRGPLAYLVGHRRLAQKQRAAAVRFFTIARDTAATDTPLRRLAQAELDRLKAK